MNYYVNIVCVYTMDIIIIITDTHTHVVAKVNNMKIEAGVRESDAASTV